jgi:hypothetical protein
MKKNGDMSLYAILSGTATIAAPSRRFPRFEFLCQSKLDGQYVVRFHSNTKRFPSPRAHSLQIFLRPSWEQLAIEDWFGVLGCYSGPARPVVDLPHIFLLWVGLQLLKADRLKIDLL